MKIWNERKYPEQSILKRSEGVLDNSTEEYIIKLFIRTCLSRLSSNHTVLLVFEEMTYSVKPKTDILYDTFDLPLRRGKLLDEAISVLGDKMLELVPEYQEFLKNNNK